MILNRQGARVARKGDLFKETLINSAFVIPAGAGIQKII